MFSDDNNKEVYAIETMRIIGQMAINIKNAYDKWVSSKD
jgi:hypothetical protein